MSPYFPHTPVASVSIANENRQVHFQMWLHGCCWSMPAAQHFVDCVEPKQKGDAGLETFQQSGRMPPLCQPRCYSRPVYLRLLLHYAECKHESLKI